MDEILIITIIDRHLKSWLEKGLNSLPEEIEPEMANPNEPPNDEGWQNWYPISSMVTDSEIESLEKALNVLLPNSYKIFLKHKHFYELYISEAHFSGHQIRYWKRHLLEMAFEGYPRELLIDKGYIPFADWSDWGMLCFNTNISRKDNEYPIILWDHDRWDDYEPFSENFYSLLQKLDAESNLNNG